MIYNVFANHVNKMLSISV